MDLVLHKKMSNIYKSKVRFGFFPTFVALFRPSCLSKNSAKFMNTRF